MTTKKKLAIGRYRMYVLREGSVNIMNNTDEIVKVAETFYAVFCASNARLGNSIERDRLVGQASSLAKDKVEKALKWMKREKAAGDDGITVNLINDDGDIVQGKLAKLFSKCLRTLKVQLA